jgi:hypothetical protein
MPTKQSLQIPVTQEQIAAAQKMWQDFQGDYPTDRVLEIAKEKFPENTNKKWVLLKAALLNSLYATNVYYLYEAAARIVEVFEIMSLRPGKELVVELSKVQVNGKTHNLVSFASKYVHFFHDDSVFIFDKYAAIALACHYGFLANQIEGQRNRWHKNYNEYCDRIDDLKRPEAAEIDHYLWLAGNWVKWRDHGDKAEISKPLKEFFKRENIAKCAEDTFGILMPGTQQRNQS